MPWKPSLNGNTLNACALLKDLAENDERPSIRRAEEKPWTVGAVGPEVERAGAAWETILESVLMIWRLQMTQELGAEDRDWQNHLVAWLVRDTWLRQRECRANFAIDRSDTGTSVGPLGFCHCASS